MVSLSKLMLSQAKAGQLGTGPYRDSNTFKYHILGLKQRVIETRNRDSCRR
jgi:hypothetical protein